jgi:glutamate synthase (NADPH/NADH) small chain
MVGLKTVEVAWKMTAGNRPELSRKKDRKNLALRHWHWFGRKTLDQLVLISARSNYKATNYQTNVHIFTAGT